MKSQSEELMRHDDATTEDDDVITPVTRQQRSMSIEAINDAGDGDEQTTPRSCPMRRSGSLRDDRLLYLSRYRDEFRSDDESGPRMFLEQHDRLGYSPKLSGRKEEPKQQRRIKLGTKAADLFAKLQMKLSTGKRGDGDNTGAS